MLTDPKLVLQHMRDKCEKLWRNEAITAQFGVVDPGNYCDTITGINPVRREDQTDLMVSSGQSLK